MDFMGRRAIVTGGAHGIGAAIATRLMSSGAAVVVLDLEAALPQVRTVTVDLADAQAVVRAAGDALDLLGSVDILVNCAGTSQSHRTIELDFTSYQRTLAVNLHAPVLLMREICRHMSQTGYGRVVNVTSIHARLSEPGSLAYDVSKAGLEAATRTAAIELATSGVLVNAVAPGFVATRMSIIDGQDELESEWFQTLYVDNSRLPVQRAATPAEIAETVAWLASESNSYIAGQVLTVDGGLSARF
jgi:NAD(P)-dependent dehydrogenase (short-subunit alcohol dehydrogenase family)